MEIKLLSKYNKTIVLCSLILSSCGSIDHCDCVDKMTKWKEQGMFVNKTIGDEAVKCRDLYSKVESHPEWQWQKQVEYADHCLVEAIRIAESECKK